MEEDSSLETLEALVVLLTVEADCFFLEAADVLEDLAAVFFFWGESLGGLGDLAEVADAVGCFRLLPWGSLSLPLLVALKMLLCLIPAPLAG